VNAGGEKKEVQKPHSLLFAKGGPPVRRLARLIELSHFDYKSMISIMRTLRFIYSDGHSSCCGYKELLVRSRAGGFVSRNCLKCGKASDYVKPQHLPHLDCEICAVSLKVEKLDGENYFYKCFTCKRTWKLADQLPHWSELFEYSGLATPGEYRSE
jgi:hypothetical protein